MLGIVLLICLFWLPALFIVVRNIFWDLYLWQVKEYRFDRMISHLLNQEEDRKQSTPIYLLKIFSLLSLMLYLFTRWNILLPAIGVIFAIYIFETILNFQLTIYGRLIRPKISVRNLMVLGLSFITVLIPFFMSVYPAIVIYDRVGDEAVIDSEAVENMVDAVIGLAPEETEGYMVYPVATVVLIISGILTVVTDLTTPITVSVFVFLTEPFSQIRRLMLINQAKRKIQNMKNLKIIGITGSFGKTTTKELIYQILQNKINVVKTPKNYNSAVGIAKSVIDLVNEDTKIFIAEMGAYTRNEIKKATDVVKPDISIVTGVDVQHLSLFGSIENIARAKFEIIENAKNESIAILNGDNEYTLQMAQKTKKETYIYFIVNDRKKLVSTSKEVRSGETKHKNENTIFAYEIERGKDGVDLKIKFNNEIFNLNTNIQGIHNVSNLLAAILASYKAGFQMKDIVDIINTTKFKLPYMNRLNGLNSTIILDDGYNANSSGFLAALDELEHIKPQSPANKKLVMTKGIMELGWEKKNVYTKIAEKIVKVSHGIITSDKILGRIIQKVNPGFPVIIPKDDIYSFVKAYNMMTEQNDIVLLEGSMHGKVLKEIIDES